MSEYESNPKVFRTNRQNLTRMIQSSKSNEDDSMKNYTTPEQKSQDKPKRNANPQPVRQGVADNDPPIESIDYLVNRTYPVGSTEEKNYIVDIKNSGRFHGKLSKRW